MKGMRRISRCQIEGPDWSCVGILDLKEMSFKSLFHYVFPPNDSILEPRLGIGIYKWGDWGPRLGWLSLLVLIAFPVWLCCITEVVGPFIAAIHFFTLGVTAPRFIGLRIFARILKRKGRDPVLIDAICPFSLFFALKFVLIVDPFTAMFAAFA